MLQLLQYYGQFQSFRRRVTRLPAWSRLIIGILAAPGAVLLALSLVAIVISILALLVLTVPAYRVLSALLLGRPVSPDVTQMDEFVTANPNRRHVDVKIVES